MAPKKAIEKARDPDVIAEDRADRAANRARKVDEGAAPGPATRRTTKRSREPSPGKADRAETKRKREKSPEKAEPAAEAQAAGDDDNDDILPDKPLGRPTAKAAAGPLFIEDDGNDLPEDPLDRPKAGAAAQPFGGMEEVALVPAKALGAEGKGGTVKAKVAAHMADDAEVDSTPLVQKHSYVFDMKDVPMELDRLHMAVEGFLKPSSDRPVSVEVQLQNPHEPSLTGLGRVMRLAIDFPSVTWTEDGSNSLTFAAWKDESETADIFDIDDVESRLYWEQSPELYADLIAVTMHMIVDPKPAEGAISGKTRSSKHLPTVDDRQLQHAAWQYIQDGMVDGKVNKKTAGLRQRVWEFWVSLVEDGAADFDVLAELDFSGRLV